MKNRLIELLGKADEATEILTGDFPSYEEELKAFYSGIADYLLDNGVIVLPCAVGDMVWEIDEYATGFKARPMTVLSIKLKENEGFVYAAYSDEDDNFVRGYGFDDFGEILLLTKEEAERKLAELEGISDGTM